jgi:hypothetical protein
VLYLFEAGCSTFSSLIASQLADASGEATFNAVVLPSFTLGADHFLVVRHIEGLGAEDFSDAFTLLSAGRAAARALDLRWCQTGRDQNARVVILRYSEGSGRGVAGTQILRSTSG